MLRRRWRFYDWDVETGEVRLMCSFDTTEADVDELVDRRDGRRRPDVRGPSCGGPPPSAAARPHATTEQVAPLSVKEVGALFVPVCEPLKPMSVEAPGASVEFQDRFLAVTAAPD